MAKNNLIIQTKSPVFFVLVISATVLLSCKKDSDNQPPPVNSRPAALLRSLKWDDDKESHFYYNTDSTIKERIDKFGAISDKIQFNWENGNMVQHHQEISMHTNMYTYNNLNQLISIRNRYKDLPSENGYELKFDYHSSGQLLFMTYHQINEAGSKMIQRTFYTFNPDKTLQKASSFDASNKKQIDFTIDSYSDSCDFLPWVYISPSLHVLYQIHNYPVLANLRKYPTKITQQLYNQDGSIASTVIYENNPVINDYRIMKLNQEIKYPANPSHNGAVSVDYFY